MENKNEIPKIIKNDSDKSVFISKQIVFFNVNLDVIKIYVQEHENVVICCNNIYEHITVSGICTFSAFNFPYIFASFYNETFIEIYFINKEFKLKVQWGTDHPLLIQDKLTRMFVKVLAYGQIDLTIDDSKKFLENMDIIPNTIENEDFLNDYLFKFFLNHIKRILIKALNEAGENILQSCSRKDMVSHLVERDLQNIVFLYGLNIANFYMNNLQIESNQQLEQIQESIQKQYKLDSFSKISVPEYGSNSIVYIENISNCEQVQVGTKNSQQSSGITAIELQLILDEILSNLPLDGYLKENDKSEIMREIYKINNELKNFSPKKDIISKALGTIKSVCEGIAGSLIAGIIQKWGIS